MRTACAPYGDTNVWAPVVTGLASLFGIDADATADEVAGVIRGRAEELWNLAPDDPVVTRFLDVVSPPPRAPLAARQARRRRGPGRRAGHVDRHGPASRPDVDDRARRRQPAVGRSRPARPARCRRAHAVGPAVPPRHDATPGRRARVAAARRASPRRAGPARAARAATTPPRSCAASSTTPAASTPRPIVADLVARGGGNPLFLVELASLATTCAGNDLPGSLRALIAARIDQLPARATGHRRQRVRARHRRLDRLARALRPGDGPGVPPARPRRAGRRRADRRRRLVVAVPQRRRARGRLPDADEARPGPAPRRRRRRDGRARGVDRRRRPPRRHGGRAARRARHRRRRQAVDHRAMPSWR